MPSLPAPKKLATPSSGCSVKIVDEYIFLLADRKSIVIFIATFKRIDLQKNKIKGEQYGKYDDITARLYS